MDKKTELAIDLGQVIYTNTINSLKELIVISKERMTELEVFAWEHSHGNTQYMKAKAYGRALLRRVGLAMKKQRICLDTLQSLAQGINRGEYPPKFS